jgi:hypothetical protein
VKSSFRIPASQSQLKEPHDGPGLNPLVFNASTTGDTHSSLMPSSISFSSEGERKKDRAFELV